MDSLKGYLAPLGRLLMSSFFIWAGYRKLMNPGGTAQAFAERYHVPLPDVAVWIAVVIELIGGLMILVGFQKTAMSSGAGERRFSSPEGLETEFQFAALGLLRSDNQDERAASIRMRIRPGAGTEGGCPKPIFWEAGCSSSISI